MTTSPAAAAPDAADRSTVPTASVERSVEHWRRLHDENAYFDRHPRYTDPLHDLGVERTLGMLGLDGTETVLEIGCGYGRLLHHLQPHAARVVGVELAPEPLARARALLSPRGPAELHLGDGSTLRPVADASIDAACCFTVLQHMPRAAAASYLRDTRRVLRPGGRVVLQWFDDGHYGRDILDETREQSVSYAPREAAAMIEAAGLRLDRFEREELDPMYPGRGLSWLWTLAVRPA